MKIGIKYCGGCNPHYDRSAMVKKLQEEFPALAFQFDSSVDCPIWLAVNGCAVACAEQEQLPASEVITLTQPKDFFRLRPRLEALSRCTKAEDAADGSLSFLSVGAQVSMTRSFSASDVNSFAELTGDANGMHRSGRTAAEGLFHQPVVHGILVSSLLSALMGTRLPGSGTILLEEQISYRSPVLIGEPITATLTFESYTENRSFYLGSFAGCCTKADGQTAVTARYRQMMSKIFFKVT